MTGHEQDIVFIIAAYAGVGVVTLGLIFWVWLQSRSVKAKLTALDAQGIRRRSAAPTSGTTA